MPSQIKVMSYNIRYDNPNDQKYVWRQRRDYVASTIRFHDPDIVGLQEALHDQLRDLDDRLPQYEWLSAGRRDSTGENAGEYAAIGYTKDRFNLESEGTFWLSESPSEPGSVGWDAMLPRLVRYAKFREHETDIEFYHFNTHFDHAGETARVKSAELLRESITELAGDLPIVVTGDFNSREGEPPYERLTSGGGGRTLLDSHHIATYMHHGPTTTMTDFQSLVPEKKIDHVLVSRDVEVRLHGAVSDTYGDGQYPSDHLPLLVELSLPLRRSVPT